jgi:hypothetical protein
MEAKKRNIEIGVKLSKCAEPNSAKAGCNNLQRDSGSGDMLDHSYCKSSFRAGQSFSIEFKPILFFTFTDIPLSRVNENEESASCQLAFLLFSHRLCINTLEGYLCSLF